MSRKRQKKLHAERHRRNEAKYEKAKDKKRYPNILPRSSHKIIVKQ